MSYQTGLAINYTDNRADFVSRVSVIHSLALGSHFASDFSIKSLCFTLYEHSRRNIHSYDTVAFRLTRAGHCQRNRSVIVSPAFIWPVNFKAKDG